MVVNKQRLAAVPTSLPKNQIIDSSSNNELNNGSKCSKDTDADNNNNNVNNEEENGKYQTITRNSPINAENTSRQITDSRMSSSLASPSSSNLLASSSPIHNGITLSSEPSSSSESENSDEQEIEYTAKCSCGEHQGKEMLNLVFNLSVNYLWESLFGHTEFCKKYWESRKFGNFKITDWKAVNTFIMRQLEYTVDLGTIGRPKNTEDQKIIEYRPNVCIVLESESATHGVPYSDCFTVRNRFCLTRVTSNSTRLCITSFLNYLQKPNFIAKSFIERNCMGALKDSYNYLEKNIPKVVQSNEIPVHISAVTHQTGTSLLDKNVTKHVYSSSSSNTILTNSTISNNSLKNTNDINENVNNNNNNTTINTRSLANGSKYPTGNSIKKRTIRGLQAEYSSINENSNEIQMKSNHKTQPQLVPIQKFSFFKWEINVDTLVRLFIIAMICLMVINAMLYYKLRRIETLADGLRNDPNVLAKISSNQQLVQPKQYENKLNENSLLNDLHGWRDVISNTLNVIEKMESSLKEWDKSLEKRQAEKDVDSITGELKEKKKDL